MADGKQFEYGQSASEVQFQDEVGKIKNRQGEAVLEVNDDQEIFLATSGDAVKIKTFINDPSMATADETSLATSLSIKTYVDASTTGSGSFTDITVDTDTLVANKAGYTDKVGIGTATPTEKLHIAGATRCGNRIDIDDSGSSDRVGLLGAWNDVAGGTVPNGKDFVVKAEAGLGIAISPNNSAPVAYAAVNGNFGIGTTAPTEKLEVEGTLKVSGATTHGNRVEIREGATSHTSAQLAAWNDLGGGSVPPDGRDFVIKAGADLGISLAPGNGGSKVYVNKLGNVGIGTTAPTKTLDVVGDAKVSGAVTLSSTEIILTGLPTSDPGVDGQLYRSGTTLLISAG